MEVNGAGVCGKSRWVSVRSVEGIRCGPVGKRPGRLIDAVVAIFTP
jgi:hypothetical protein